MFSFLHLINNSVTVGLFFFITKHITYHIIKTINILHFLFELFKISSMSFEYSIKVLESFKCFKPALFLMLIKN